MAAKREDSVTKVERTSDRELVVTRVINGPPHLVFAAWTKPELFQRWWAPKSFGVTMLACEMDVGTGGAYRLTMNHASLEKPMDFHGKYLEVTPNAKIVWTNDEGEGEGAVTTVTFAEHGDATLVTVRDLYPSEEALDEAMASGATSGFPEQFDQLDAVLVA